MNPLTILLISQIIWTGPKLNPSESAAILKPNEFKSIPVYDGPKVFILYHRPEWYEYNPYYNWRYNGFYQTRINLYQRVFRGFGSQMQDRRLVSQYKRWNKDYRQRVRRY